MSVARLRQRAADLKVHPDETAKCIELYVDSLSFAGLVHVEGDKIAHSPLKIEEVSKSQEQSTRVGEESTENREENNDLDEENNNTDDARPKGPGVPRAVFNVSVNLDSSLDTEKLEKQLALLKRFGAI